MERTIRVRGSAKASATPDYIIITMTLEATEREYDKAVGKASAMLDAAEQAVVECGFAKDDLKTTRYNVSAQYRSVRTQDGTYREEFSGYCVSHSLLLGFDFSSQRLSAVLSSIASGIAEPRLNVRFTVKDTDALSSALLSATAKNAREKARILADASGVKLGELLSVEYGAAEHDFSSRAEFALEERCMMKADCAPRNFTPEDIELSDSATFVFAIKD